MITAAVPALVVAGAFIVSGCVTTFTSSSTEGELTIPNGLEHGGGDDGIIVEFTAVASDSRCPAGVQCITAGRAVVSLGITEGGRSRKVISLEAPPGTNVEYETADGFLLTVLELRPSPPPVGGVDQGAYVLRLRIEKSD